MAIHSPRPTSDHSDSVAPATGAEPPMDAATASEVALLRQHMATLQQEVASQRAQIAALIQQLNQPMATPVEIIEAHDASIAAATVTLNGTAPENPLPTARTTTTRRALLKWGGLGAAAVAAAGTAALSATPTAHAADGDTMLLGSSNSATAGTLLINNVNSGPQGFVVSRYSNVFPTGIQDMAACIVGIGGQNDLGTGVLGVGAGSINSAGVMGISLVTGPDLCANGTGAILQKATNIVGPPPGYDVFVGQLIRDSNGDMYLCMNLGNNDLGIPPLWKKLGSLTNGYKGGATGLLPTPLRIYDTRKSGGPFHGNAVRNVQIAPVSPPFYPPTAVPLGAVGCIGNLTVTNVTAGGYVVIYPQGSPTPSTSTVNFQKGQTSANSFVVGLGSTGQVSIRTFTSGQCDVILDITGFIN